MTPPQVAWQIEQGIQQVNFMDMPESVVVILIIFLAAVISAYIFYWIFRLLEWIFRME